MFKTKASSIDRFLTAPTTRHLPSGADMRLLTTPGSVLACTSSYRRSEPKIKSNVASSSISIHPREVGPRRSSFPFGLFDIFGIRIRLRPPRSESSIQSSLRTVVVVDVNVALLTLSSSSRFLSTATTRESSSGCSKSVSATELAPSLDASSPQSPTPAPISRHLFPSHQPGFAASSSLSMMAARHTFAPTPAPSAISLTTTSCPPSNENERSRGPPVLERRATRRRARLERLPHVHEARIVCVALWDVARGRVAHVRGVGLPRLVRVRRVGGHLFRELRCRPCPAPGRDLGVPYGVQPVADVLAGDEGGVPVALVRHLVSHRRRVATCSLLGGDVTDVVWTGTARGCQNLVGSSAAEIPRLPRF